MAHDLDFSGKTALVVGGSSGIGNAMAQRFRRNGAETHVWGTRATASDYDSAEGSDLKGLHYAQMNVADFDALDAYAPPFPKLDVLILSQGIVLYEQKEFTREGWDAVMDVNINSVMHTARKFHPMLKESNGAIVIVSSIAGYRSIMASPAYAASKAGAVHLTKTLGEAWSRDGIRVNGVAPGLVETKMTKTTTDDERRMGMILRQIPLRRTGEPEEIANAALFLASPMASYVQGQTLIVDGGMTLS